MLVNTCLRQLWALSRSQPAAMRRIPATLAGSCCGRPFHLPKSQFNPTIYFLQGCLAGLWQVSGPSESIFLLIVHSANSRFDQAIKNILTGTTNCGAGGSSNPCTQTYTVKSGDTCSAIEAQNGISDAQLHALNPAINSGCTSMFWPSFTVYVKYTEDIARSSYRPNSLSQPEYWCMQPDLYCQKRRYMLGHRGPLWHLRRSAAHPESND
jgi:hypothetical protein